MGRAGQGWTRIPSVELISAYFAGVLIGLWRTDAPPVRRLGLALLWPLAAVACAVTLTVLSVATALLFPAIGLAALAIGVGWAVFG